MKTPNSLPRPVALSVLLLTLAVTGLCAAPYDSTFDYQGSLAENGLPASGTFDLRFSLWSSATGGVKASTNELSTPAAGVKVKQGIFTVTLDFGGDALNGEPRWLEVAARRHVDPGHKTNRFVTVTPRQRLAVVPYAVYATSAAEFAGQLAGDVTGRVGATVVASVAGQSAADVVAGAALARGATAANLAGALVRRDGAGNFSAGTITATSFSGAFSGNGAGLLNLSPAAVNGVLAPGQIPGLDTAKITSGALADARLGANIPRLDGNSLFTGTVSFSPPAGAPFAVGNLNKVTNLNADLLDGLDSTQFWGTRGNLGTSPNYHFVGTLDNQALDFRVNNLLALRLQPSPNGSPNIIGGGGNSSIAHDVAQSTIAGGAGNQILSDSPNSTIGGGIGNAILTNAAFSTVAGGRLNSINSLSSYSTISGGNGNIIDFHADRSTISGGEGNYIGKEGGNGVIGGGSVNKMFTGAVIAGGIQNVISNQSGGSFIGGGQLNVVQYNSYGSVIGGGVLHEVQTNSFSSVIGGGYHNVVQPNSHNSFIGCGYENYVLTNSPYSTIPGGIGNRAGGGYSFAAGRRAHALHAGSFVWADSLNQDIPSTAANEFTARATGGVRFITDAAGTAGVTLAPGSGSWSSLSDRDAKENVRPVNGRMILEKLSSLPLATWNYKSQPANTRHLGPMSQDFAEAFGLGEDDRRISSVDADGVALAAIQGLHQLVKEKNSEIETLKTDLADLRRLLENALSGRLPPPTSK